MSGSMIGAVAVAKGPAARELKVGQGKPAGPPYGCLVPSGMSALRCCYGCGAGFQPLRFP
jgi:hypothetical protein